VDVDDRLVGVRQSGVDRVHVPPAGTASRAPRSNSRTRWA
jgi:hypothetical protein